MHMMINDCAQSATYSLILLVS